MIYVVDAAAVLAFAALVAVTLVASRRLPVSIPTGYDFRSGVPIRWGPRRMFWAGPAVLMMIPIIAFAPHDNLGTAGEIVRDLFLIVIASYCAAVTWQTGQIARKRRDRLPGSLNPAVWMIVVLLVGAGFLKGF